MEQIKRITGDSIHLLSVNGDKPLKLSQINVGGGGGSTRPHYTGQTEFTPSTVTQTAQTEGLIVDSDITVNAMPIGSAKTPTVNVEANPTITMDGNGLVTASYAKTESITPSVIAGYVASGTAGNVTFRGASTYQLPSQAATAITPTESAQTAVAAGTYTTGAITVNAIPSNYIGSAVPIGSLSVSGSTVTAASGLYPSAVSVNVASGYLGATTVIAGQTASTHTYKVERQAATSGWYEAASVKNAGTVILNNQSIGATPTESAQTFTPTNLVSYITQVTVNPIPSEYIIPSGTKQITENGTGIDVAEYASVDVNVPAPPAVDVEPLSVTDNGTYTAPSGKAYSPVTVNVSGGGGGSAEPNDVEYIDYDGTIVYSYSAADFAQLTAHPANPSHDGLVAQGWNWTLSDAQAYVAENGGLTIGQMYITESGDTEIDVEMPEVRLSPILTIAVNGSVMVDWGDGTTPNTVTGTSLTTRKSVSHTYASAGNYTIKIHVVTGSFTFYGGSTSYTILRKNTTANQNRVYANCVKAVRLGDGITSIGLYAFLYCSSLASITIPSEVTGIGDSVFASCFCLAPPTIPSGVTSIGNYAFSNCYGLASITIPSGVTSIGNYAFSNCYGLASITIPSGVTSIGNYAFQSCGGVGEYHVNPTTPPTIASYTFSGISSDCKFYVPAESLEAYKTAQYWSNYASQMVGK